MPGDPVSREQLRAHLAAHGFLAQSYALDGEHRDEAHVLEQGAGSWSVYYAERGHRRDELTFTDEADAVACLLERLQQDPTTRARPEGSSG